MFGSAARHLRRNLVAYVALFVALTSSGYAASTKLLPPNSVGTKQVINHSLLKKDFMSGQLPRGPHGPQGPQGLQGPQGRQGPQGPQRPQGLVGARGPAGTASASIADSSGSVGFCHPLVDPNCPPTGTVLVSLRLDAGSYAIFGTIDINSNTGPHGTEGNCTLLGDDAAIGGGASIPAEATPENEVVSVSGLHTFASPGSVSVACSSPVDLGASGSARIIAVQVTKINP